MIQHTKVRLERKSRGFHLITNEVLEKVGILPKEGVCHIFIQHTSASLTLNENADPDVRHDFEVYMNAIAPENKIGIRHTIEGSDDMPAHVKSSLLGSSVSIPIVDGCLALGIWQGIYLCEHRDNANGRNIIVTVYS